VDPARVPALLGAADLFVLPSRREGLPIALLEAMEAGLAIVATPVGGIPEALAHGEAGVLVPAGDARALADALAALARDPARRRALSEAARARAHARYSRSAGLAALGTLWRDLVQCT
jgi:glycosyltransferase involved in cell wall biosynthesis